MSVCLSTCLSVCPSVCHTPVFCRNGYTYHYTFQPSGSHNVLVFFLYQTIWQYSDGDHLTGCRMQEVWKKIAIFHQYIALSCRWYKIEPSQPAWTVVQTVLTKTSIPVGICKFQPPQDRQKIQRIWLCPPVTPIPKVGRNSSTVGFWANGWKITKIIFIYLNLFSLIRSDLLMDFCKSLFTILMVAR